MYIPPWAWKHGEEIDKLIMKWIRNVCSPRS
jgi:hypothetical protein